MGLLLLLLLGSVSAAVNPIVVKGNKLYDSVTKKRFFIKGVDYAPDPYPNDSAGGTAVRYQPGMDHFTNDQEDVWGKDIPYLVGLHINALRIYDFDPSLNHTKFMNALEDAGIYVILGMTATIGPGVLDASKTSPDCYTQGLVYSVKLRINAFAGFKNTLMFVVGNEIGNAVNIQGQTEVLPGFHAIPCVKALVRDMRAYMKSCACGMRQVPIVYAATDLGDYSTGTIKTRMIISQYLSCGEHSVDVYGINMYTWCASDAGYDFKSTYSSVNTDYSTWDLPVVLTEFGCNQADFGSTYPFTTKQRTWNQVDVLFDQMTDVFSGGLAYQYSMTENDYGMVLLPGYMASNPDTIVTLENYDNLASKYLAFDPVETGDWTENDRCTWKPANSVNKMHPTCPSVAVVQELFDVAGFVNFTETWHDELPPMPAGTDIPCSAFPLDAVTRAEVSCVAECTCGVLTPETECMIAEGELTPEQQGNMMSRLCGYFEVAGASECDDISPGGNFAGCGPIQKANYLLSQWYDFKSGRECCKTLSTSYECAKDYDCELLDSEEKCMVADGAQTETQLGEMITQLCGMLSLVNGQSCDEISPSGKFHGCTPTALKANHLLKEWFDIKKGRECCAGLIVDGKCSPVEPDTKLRIVTQPASVEVDWRAAASIMVAVEGGWESDYAFRWTKDGTLLENGGRSVTISHAEEKDAGVYVVEVSDSDTTVTSAAATLTVKTPHAASVSLTLTGISVQDLRTSTEKNKLSRAIAMVLNSTFGVEVGDVSIEEVSPTSDGSVMVDIRVRISTQYSADSVSPALETAIADGSLVTALNTFGLNVEPTTVSKVCLLAEILNQGAFWSSDCEAKLLVGDTCAFTCLREHDKLSGADQRKCGVNGWEGEPLTCDKIPEPAAAKDDPPLGLILGIVGGVVVAIAIAVAVVFLCMRCRGSAKVEGDSDLYATLNTQNI